ncbi:MAG: hypothetical protein IKO75_13130 [Bacteroidales bacterium]|nr:hypothetical protein [Bacteroidales bacterium]
MPAGLTACEKKRTNSHIATEPFSPNGLLRERHRAQLSCHRATAHPSSIHRIIASSHHRLIVSSPHRLIVSSYHRLIDIPETTNC